MQNKTHARFRPSSNDSQVCLILIVNYFFVIKLLNNFYTKNCDADASCVLLKLSSSNLCPIFIWFAASFVFSNKLLCWIFGFNVFFFKLSVILLSHSVAIAIISFVCYLLFFFGLMSALSLVNALQLLHFIWEKSIQPPTYIQKMACFIKTENQSKSFSITKGLTGRWKQHSRAFSEYIQTHWVYWNRHFFLLPISV